MDLFLGKMFGWMALIAFCLLISKPFRKGSFIRNIFVLPEEDSNSVFQTQSGSPVSVVLEEKQLDLSNIKIDEYREDKKHLFRPQTWEQYISQNNVKGEMVDNIKGCANLGEQYPHTILSGMAGHGKTALAHLLSKEMGLHLVECVGNDLRERQTIVDKIAEAQGGVLFIDEIHTVSTNIGNWLLPVIEDFKIQGRNIEPFTLIGATTEKGELIKRLKPFVDRFEQLQLEEYVESDIKKIIEQFHSVVYPQCEVSDEVFTKISNNSRLTPRNALRLLKLFVRSEDIDKIFERKGIVKDGITKTDIKLLKYLNDTDKAVGLETLSFYLGTSKNNYLYEVEGYLIQQGLILRQPRGRSISEKGKELLNETM